MYSKIFRKLIAICCLTGCMNKESCSHYEKETELFIHYLHSTFQMNDLNEDRYFFIVPSSACSGCEKTAVSLFYKLCSDKAYYLIITKNNLSSIKSISCSNILIDSAFVIDRLNIPVSNTTLIYIHNKCIKNIMTLTPEKADSLAQYIQLHNKQL